MNATIEFLKEKFSSFISPLKEKFLSFYEENKKLTYLIAGLIAALLLCIILLISTAGKNKKQKEVPGQKLELTEKLVIPNGPELPKDYTVSRKTKEKWTDEEADPWFTTPSQKEIESLGNANDNLVNEIIGAAP